MWPVIGKGASVTTVHAILQDYPPETEWAGSDFRVPTSWLLNRWSSLMLDRDAIMVEDTVYGVAPDGAADLQTKLLIRSPWVEVVSCMKPADADRLFLQWLEHHQVADTDLEDSVIVDLVRVVGEQGGHTERRYRVHRNLIDRPNTAPRRNLAETE